MMCGLAQELHRMLRVLLHIRKFTICYQPYGPWCFLSNCHQAGIQNAV